MKSTLSTLSTKHMNKEQCYPKINKYVWRHMQG